MSVLLDKKRKPIKQMREEIEKLRQEINEHDYCYHVLDAPLISDAEYHNKKQT